MTSLSNVCSQRHTPVSLLKTISQNITTNVVDSVVCGLSQRARVLSPAKEGTRAGTPCGLRGCKNRAHSVSSPEVVKGVQNQGVDCFVSWGSFFCFSFVFLVYVVLYLIVFGCQYQCNWLPGSPRNDLLCVEWDVKPYTLTHSRELGVGW